MNDNSNVILENFLIPMSFIIKYLGVKSTGYFTMAHTYTPTYFIELKQIWKNINNCLVCIVSILVSIVLFFELSQNFLNFIGKS